jgi:phosphopantothenoylcysteine decarboxylase/phosphopantothenate--cysteine ligase
VLLIALIAFFLKQTGYYGVINSENRIYLRETMKNEAGSTFKGVNIVLGVTGCIAAYKACELVSRFTQAGAVVRVIMTVAAGEFVKPLSFRTLSGQPVFTGMFTSPGEYDPAHVSLADWARIVVIAPATANIIGKIAHGIADDLLSCTVMATKAPVLIAPAMNVHMWENAVVQENISKLRQYGYRFVDPEDGYLACGYRGKGRLASSGRIIEETRSMIGK